MKSKKIFIGIIIFTIIIGSSVFATDVKQSIEVVFNQVNIEVNGKKVEAENIVYNNTTYVPLRRVAEMLSKEVTWNEETQTAGINDIVDEKGNKKDNNLINDNDQKGLMRKYPAKLNDVVEFNIDDRNNNSSDIQMKSLEIIRGEKAWNILHDANMCNDEPDIGFEYMLVKFYFKLVSTTLPGTYDLTGYDFDLISGNGKQYDKDFIVEPKPKIDTDLFEGAEHEGWVAFQIEKDDLKPLIVYRLNYDGTGGIWFKGYTE